MDLYIVQLLDAIPLVSVQNVPAGATTPRKLLLSGRDFSRVVEVVVEGESIENDWEDKGTGKLLVSLPNILKTSTITSVQAYSDSAHDMQASKLVLRIGAGTRVTGAQYCVQLLVKWLFTDPNTDAWNPEAGGGWKQALTYADTADDGASMIPDLNLGLSRVVSYIQKIQAQDLSIPPEEKLASAVISRTLKLSRGIRVVVEVKTVGEDKAIFAVRS